MDGQLILDSLRRRVRAMHSLWYDAVGSMGAEQVNHVERDEVLPIAFSLFHLAQIEDGSVSMLGGPGLVYDDGWGTAMGLAIADHGKHRSVEEMVGQRIGDYERFCEYQRLVFSKTEDWLDSLAGGGSSSGSSSPLSLDEIVVARPFPPQIASTFSARVAGPEGITRLDGIECWLYQHGLRHMGEIEHARALVGLKGMTS